MDYNYFETLKNKVGEMKSRRDHIGQDIQRMRSEEMSISEQIAQLQRE
jgi:chromosome segregation ATPase